MSRIKIRFRKLHPLQIEFWTHPLSMSETCNACLIDETIFHSINFPTLIYIVVLNTENLVHID